MMYVNKLDQCFNLSRANALILGFDNTVHVVFSKSDIGPIEKFDTKQEAIDFIRHIAKEMNK